MSTETPQEEHDDGYDYPGIPFIHVNEVVADETGNQAANRDDDDADNKWQGARIDGCQSLTA